MKAENVAWSCIVQYDKENTTSGQQPPPPFLNIHAFPVEYIFRGPWPAWNISYFLKEESRMVKVQNIVG